ncbi:MULTISPECIES: hypothetical protein [unclassified Mesorhizobium]|uniref:hypothetical protein n=1 Tax=unclassified Mesorhizobium TaxID=325217 RepID=UPI0011261632|nr:MULTISPECIES: hypothetical protein [unclassified Mesorhizobium]MCA0027339.1 hypothetical protein [Mesorhizobium sp. B263B1A]TPJ98614.1 hypothetical protein FJ489_06715 [Mesorhizobium sp. B2-5-12]TPK28776.1 hypothetical protein FJ562_00105 [Mesorhizobium sp. B2-5-6]
MGLRPTLFAGMGEAFARTFGGDKEALVTVAPGDVRRIPDCIFREFREGGFGEEDGAAIEGVTHTLKFAASADPGVVQDMPVEIVDPGQTVGQSFVAAGVHFDGRAMTRVLLATP